MLNSIENIKIHVLSSIEYGDVVASAIISLIVEEKYDFVLERHLTYMDKSGNTTGCGCILCRIAHAYTQAKKALHRDNARYLNDDYFFNLSNEQQKFILDAIPKTKKEIDRLKKDKENFTQLLLSRYANKNKKT